MPLQANINLATSVMGMTFNYNGVQQGDAAAVVNVALGPAKAGVLTTRTDDNTGTLTMTPGHGITTGQRLDLYWDGGQRRGITVGTVSGNSVPIDLGAGDNLPVVNTDITAMVPNVETVSFDGDDAVFMQFGTSSTTAVGQFVVAESDDTEITSVIVEEGVLASVPWFEDSGITNPLAGATAAKIYCSHGDATTGVSVTLKGTVLYN